MITSTDSTTSLQHELDTLERRLRDGERRIAEASAAGADTETWVDFWIELLHRYEAVYRRLTESADQPEGEGRAS